MTRLRSRTGWILLGATSILSAGAAVLRGMIRGQLTVDLGIGRSTRPLGPFVIDVMAPRDIVFDVAAAPYGPRPPSAARDHIEILQRSAEGTMVLAAHRTRVGRSVAITVEGVTLRRPTRIGFRSIRGPVPYVVEEFLFDDNGGSTTITYKGELGTDLWSLGRRWGAVVAPVWEGAVRHSLEQIREAAERRARSRDDRHRSRPQLHQ